MDLTQMRWLQIRAFETQQTVEKENLDLRRQVKDLQDLQRENSGSHKQALYTFAKYLFNWLQREKQNLQSLKVHVYAEVDKSRGLINDTSNVLKTLTDKWKLGSAENAKLRRENECLRAEMEKNQKDGSGAVSMKMHEIDRLKSKLIKLQEELGAFDCLKINLNSTIDGLKADLEQSQYDKSLLTSKYEVYYSLLDNFPDYNYTVIIYRQVITNVNGCAPWSASWKLTVQMQPQGASSFSTAVCKPINRFWFYV
jgi:chromosome segregation ATPase